MSDVKVGLFLPWRLALTLALTLLTCGCSNSGSKRLGDARTPAQWRELDAAELSDESATAWLAAELIGVGGRSQPATTARKLIDERGVATLRAHLTRGIDDAVHGRLETATGHFMRAASVARTSDVPEAPLFADFAVQQALHYAADPDAFWQVWGDWIELSLREPLALGYGARDRLVRRRVAELWRNAAGDADKLAVELGGCATHARFAGPFGSALPSDLREAFEPEAEVVWPAVFAPDPQTGRRAQTSAAEAEGCHLSLGGASPGVYYAEVSARLPRSGKVLVDAVGALKVWVDGALVLDRDVVRFGAWTRRVAGVELVPGVHRIVARLASPDAKIRLLDESGRPADVEFLDAASPMAVLAKPRPFEANPLARYLTPAGDVTAPTDPLTAYVAATLSAEYGEAEVGSLLLEPLVKEPAQASGAALALAAEIVQRDDLFGETQRQDLAQELHERAAAKDAELWASATQLAASVARAKGLVEGARELAALVDRFPQVPGLLKELANVYGELGWRPEHDEATLLRAERFAGDAGALLDASEVLEANGHRERAAQLRARAIAIDPDNGALVQRALESGDFAAAQRELSALRKRRPEEPSLDESSETIELALSDDPYSLSVLQARNERDPQSEEAWLALYDAHLARDEADAAAAVFAKALAADTDTAGLRAARDLVAGVSPLVAFRLDGRKVIAEWEASGQAMEGIAARVLDYMAVRVHADGSSELLEHEIIRIQSEEAIAKFAEYEPRPGHQLQMRVLKADGRALEPERVAEKPTLTFPHLEIGDYIETEQVMATRATGGAAYDGPQWFFREQDVAYARSEFVLITPADKELEILTTGQVPQPLTSTDGYYMTRHWRMDNTPAAPVEPLSVPPSEYLPSLKISWGLTKERRLRALAARVVEVAPLDPRLIRVAKAIVKPLPESAEDARARKLYHWVLDNVQPGEELDGPRVVVSKRGNRFRAMAALCRALGIDLRWAVARNSLAPEPRSEGERVSQFNNTVLRVGSRRPSWIVVDDVPYGYLPPGVRGSEAYLLGADVAAQPVVLSGGASDDSVSFELRGDLRLDGSAGFELDQTYRGIAAARLRRGLREVAPNRLGALIEARLLGIPGASVLEHQVHGLDDVRSELRLHVVAEVGVFARATPDGFLVEPPFAFGLGQLASLPTRKTTMLLSPGRRQKVIARLRLPKGSVANVASPRTMRHGSLTVRITDRIEGDVLVFEREIDVAASRIAVEEYAAFAAFVRDAEDQLVRPLLVRLGGSK